VHTAQSPASLDVFVADYDGPVHLLLTDVVLPDMSGLDLADRMQKRYPALPVLFMSGYAEAAFAQGRGGAVGSHFIAKPFDRQKLLRAVRRAIDSQSASDYVHREPAAG
jgi:FixJ family two-component response regulator